MPSAGAYVSRALLFLSFGLLTTAPARADFATDLYNAAIRTMGAQPQPPYITYHLRGESEDGIEVNLVVLQGSQTLLFRPGRAQTAWTVAHRTSDAANFVSIDPQHGLHTRVSFFDPTWYGAYSELHDGILYGLQSQRPAPASTAAPLVQPPENVSDSALYNVKDAPAATPTPAPATAATSANLRTIAFVRVMGPGLYIVHDAGPAKCGDGSPARRLDLTPRSMPEVHQLRSVLVQLPSQRFCSVVFEGNGDYTTVEQHYAEVGGYWVQTDGAITTTWRYQGSSPLATLRPSWNYQLSGISFPTSMPNELFEPPQK